MDNRALVGLAIVTAIVVVGVIIFLVIARREETKRANALRGVNKALWERVLGAKPEAIDAKVESDLKALETAEHEAKTKGVWERYKK